MTDTTTHDAPPWGSDDQFTPQRAWDLIQNLRADNAKLRAARDEATAHAEQLSGQWQSKYDTLAKQAKVADDMVAELEGKYSDLAALRGKETLLAEAGLPRDLAANITGDDEDAWKTSVERFSALRTQAGQERRPDPAQAATTPTPSPDDMARDFFGLH